MIGTVLTKILPVGALVLLLTETFAVCELLQSLEGTVGRENFTYYRLTRTGDIRIELESIEGDADLVVSDATQNPDLEDCKLFSLTCGLDTVEIPHTFTRPVAIGVYGHSYYEISKYIIRIYAIPPKPHDLSYEQLMEKFYKYDPDAIESGRSSRMPSPRSSSSDPGYSSSDEEEESEGSILWQIIITILKVVFEVLL